MNDWMKEYEALLDKALREPTFEDRAKALESAMRKRVEWLARQQAGVNDTPLLHALRGMITICIELADGARAALDAESAEANGGAGEGNQ